MMESVALGKYDAAVVGGGVVGCAVLREFSSLGLSCVLCEKEENLVSGASSGNSGTLHTGFDAPLDSLELLCLQRARSLNENFFSEYEIPFRKSGGLIVAWNENDLEKLPELVAKAQKAGVTDVKQITATELLEKEPRLSPSALGAVYVPGESIVDPWRIPITLANIAIAHGATVMTTCHVTSGKRHGNEWQLSTSKGPITAKVVVNCAVYGNIMVGPTAEDQLDRSNAETDAAVIETLVNHAKTIVPSLKEHTVIGTYVGLRPATEFKDYCIECLPDDGWITVGGIRSTGLSACLGIAKHVASFLPSFGFKQTGTYLPANGFVKVDHDWKVTHPITNFGMLSSDDTK